MLFSIFFNLASILNKPLAYIDPNTGGMLFQLLAVMFAFLSGFILFFSRQIKMIAARFLRFLRNLRNN